MSEQTNVVAHPRAGVQRPKDLRGLVEDLAEWRHLPTVNTQLFIVDVNGAVFARGVAEMGSDELKRHVGKRGADPAVHRDRLVLIQPA